MAYETRAYDDEHGDPVVVLVATGSFDVSRLVWLLNKGRVEEIGLAEKIIRQVKRHNGGRAALAVLNAHGGPNFADEQSPTEPTALGVWLRGKSRRTVLLDKNEDSWQVEDGVLLSPLSGRCDFDERLPGTHNDLIGLAEHYAPFTVLREGA